MASGFSLRARNALNLKTRLRSDNWRTLTARFRVRGPIRELKTRFPSAFVQARDGLPADVAAGRYLVAVVATNSSLLLVELLCAAVAAASPRAAARIFD